MTPHLNRQIKISKMLSYGFIFTLLPVLGILSFVSVIIGVRARRMIKQSEVNLSGIVLSWWCIIVGGVRSIAFIVYIIMNWILSPESGYK
jgi:hypothetical protein